MTEPDIAADEAVVPPPPRGAMLTIFLIVLADLLGFGVIIPLLPFYAKMYAASDFQVGLLFSVYSICQLIASPILGLISDRYGRRPVLIASQIGSVLGFLLLGYATYPGMVTAGAGLVLVYISRVIDGFSGGNISTAQAYVSDITTTENRAKGMGILGAAFGIGFSIGPALGGLLGHFNIAWPAFAAAIFCTMAAIMTFIRLPESRVHRPSETEAWLHPSRFIPILQNPILVQLQLIFFASMLAFVMMEAVIALFLNHTFKFDPFKVGLIFGLAGLVIIIVQGGLIGRLSRRFGEWNLVVAGPVFVTLAMTLYMSAGYHPLIALIIFGTLFNAGGRSLQHPGLSALISHNSDPKQQGTVFGLYHMLGSLARFIGPMIATAIYTAHHTAPFAVAGCITLGIAVWTVALRRQSSRRSATIEVAPAKAHA